MKPANSHFTGLPLWLGVQSVEVMEQVSRRYEHRTAHRTDDQPATSLPTKKEEPNLINQDDQWDKEDIDRIQGIFCCCCNVSP